MSDPIWAVEWANASGAWTFHHATTSEDGAKLGIERLRHKSAKEIQFRPVEYVLASDLAASRAECERLARELHAEKQFGELWYFVMDEAAMKFEDIVCEYSPAKWMSEAAKLRAEKYGQRPPFDQSRQALEPK